MVFSAKSAGFFDGKNIHGTLNEAQERAIAARVGANVAGRFFRQGAAHFAEMHGFAGANQDLREVVDGLGFRLDQVQRNSFGRAWADAR